MTIYFQNIATIVYGRQSMLKKKNSLHWDLLQLLYRTPSREREKKKKEK